MDNIELATLAGFFAGEGNITLSGGKWPTLYAALGNTERFWVEKFHKAFGGSMYVEQPKYLGAKYMFRWRVSGKKAVTFLQTIQPFLIGEKAAQLALGLRFQHVKDVNMPGHKVPYPVVVVSELKGMCDQMRKLRCAAAENNRENASPWRSDVPTPRETGAN